LFIEVGGPLCVDMHPAIAVTARIATNGVLKNWIAQKDAAAKTQ
jgi:hypothetical protein